MSLSSFVLAASVFLHSAHQHRLAVPGPEPVDARRAVRAAGLELELHADHRVHAQLLARVHQREPVLVQERVPGVEAVRVAGQQQRRLILLRIF